MIVTFHSNRLNGAECIYLNVRYAVSIMIRFDRKSGAYTDGKHYVKASFIREYAKSKLGISQERGRLSREVLAAYFLDVHGVSADVE